MVTKMRWLGTACFEIVLPDNQTIVIDPYVDDSVNSPENNLGSHLNY